MTPKEFFDFMKKNDSEQIDLKFCDMLGTWQHCTYPIDTLDEGIFEDGLGFDGSSIRGWQAINASDMLAVPDPKTAVLDPFFAAPTVSVLADIVDPITKEKYSPRSAKYRREGDRVPQATGIADTCYIGPEPEFFIFDDIRLFVEAERGHVRNRLAWKPPGTRAHQGAKSPSQACATRRVIFRSPVDIALIDLRTEMVNEMRKVGIAVEAHHHEVATAGQCEIDMRFQELLKMGDQLMWYKYIIKNVARRNGKTVTFMPKPIFEDNGSGMHTHISLWKGSKPLMAGDGYAGLSEMAIHAIGGILKHGRALLAFAAPTANSYHRLVPGFEAPVTLAMSQRNRSAAVRIPMYSASPKAKRAEFRCPDPSCNPYLTFTAMLMAMIDGVQNKIDPGQPLDRDIYDMTPEELAETNTTPGSLPEALAALEADHAFLTKGDVFTTDLIETWVEWKREKEIDPIRLRPHPYEFELYYNA